jgi:spore coat polysaccharide biosynthesis protein SpsF
MIGHIAGRTQQAKSVDEVVIATTERTKDHAVVDLGEYLGIRDYCGSFNDISERLFTVAAGADILTRLPEIVP